MKRVIPFALTAILSMFTLGSCDKLLEAFFPEETLGDTSSGTDYSIAVTVEYDYSLISQGFGPGNTSSTTSRPIQVALVPFYETPDGFKVDEGGIILYPSPLWQNTFREDGDGDEYATTVYFDVYNYSTYKVLVWLDSDNDEWTSEEQDEHGVLVYRDNGDYWIDFRTQNPRNAGVDMGCFLSGSSSINWDQVGANPYATYETGIGSVPIASIYTDLGSYVAQNTELWFYPYQSNDSDGWIDSYKWEFYDLSDQLVASYGSTEVVYTYMLPGTYRVKLYVKDNNQNESNVDYWVTVYEVAGGGTEIVYWDSYTIDVLNITDYPIWIDTAGQYTVHWEDSLDSSGSMTYTADVAVASPGYFDYQDSGYSSPQVIYVGSAGSITISVNPIWSLGTCRVWITRIQ